MYQITTRANHTIIYDVVRKHNLSDWTKLTVQFESDDNQQPILTIHFTNDRPIRTTDFSFDMVGPR